MAPTLTPPFDRDRDHWRGGATPAVTLLMYGDFQCPYTRAAQRRLGSLQERFGDSLRVAFRHFPLTEIHPRALAAAIFAEAAAEQGRFWELYDVLFANQEALEPDDLLGYARALGVDFARADEEAILRRIQADVESGLASGVRGTPTIFLDGAELDGSHDREALRAALEAAGAVPREGSGEAGR
jgi:NhaA family Na+:H+ antiporter